MFDIDNIVLKRDGLTSKSDFQNLLLIKAFMPNAIEESGTFVHIINQVFPQIGEHYMFGINLYFGRMFCSYAEKTNLERIVGKDFAKYFCIREDPNSHWGISYKLDFDAKYLHEIRSSLISQKKDFYLNLLSIFDKICKQYRYQIDYDTVLFVSQTSFLIKLYLGTEFHKFRSGEIESLQSNKFFKYNFEYFADSLDSIPDDSNVLLNFTKENLKQFDQKLFNVIFGRTSSGFNLFFRIIKNNVKNLSDVPIYDYLVTGTLTENTPSLLFLYDRFFKGEFEKCYESMLAFRKAQRAENKKYDFAGNEKFMLEYCRVMLNKDIATMQRETNAYKKKVADTFGEDVCAALLAICSYRYGRKDADFEELAESVKSLFTSTQANELCSVGQIIFHTACAYATKIDFTKFFSKEWFENFYSKMPNCALRLYKTCASLNPALRNAKYDDLSKDYFDFTKFVDTDSVWKTQIASLKDILKIKKIEDEAAELKKAKSKKAQLSQHLGWVFKDERSLPRSYLFTINENTKEIQKAEFYDELKYFKAKNIPGYISEKDMKIFMGFDQIKYYGRKTPSDVYFVCDKCLPLIVDHPYVYLKSEDKLTKAPTFEKLTVNNKSLELVVSKKGNQLTTHLRSGEYGNTDGTVFFTLDTKKLTLDIYNLNPTQKQIKNLLGIGENTYPEEALKEIIALGRSGELEVVYDMEASKVKSETKPVMLLSTNGRSYFAKVRVQPIADEKAPYKIPGYGENSVFFKKDDKSEPIIAERDFAVEEESSKNLISKLKKLKEFYAENDYDFESDNPQDMLDLLTELNSHKEECTIHWGSEKRMYVKGSVSSSSFKLKGDLNGNGYLTVSGQVELSDKRFISLKALLASLKDSQGNFIKLDDENYVAIESDLIQRLEKLSALTSKGKKDELIAHALAGNALQSLLGDVDCTFSDNVTNLIKKRDEAMALEVQVPKTLCADLRPYQQEGFTWLYRLSQWGVGACLADDMGLGKTIQTITTMLKLASKGPILIVCPTSLCQNWANEIAKFAPTLKVKRFSEASDRKAMVEGMQKGEVLIVSYGLFAIEAEILASIKWEMAVYDEAQALKNSSTQRAKSATLIPAHMRLALTGTPIENNLDDLWSIFNIINTGLLGTKKEFHERFADVKQNKNSNRILKLLISPFILRRLKNDVLDDLPPRTEQVISIEGSTREKELYETVRLETLEKLEDEKLPVAKNGQRRLQILSALTKLRQFCCDPALFSEELNVGDSSKTQAFLDLLDEALSGGHRLLVFSQFVGYLSKIKQALDKRKISYQYLDGQTTEKKRAKAIEDFQAGEGDVFLISLKAGGQGLNLTGADYVVHLDPWWNPAVEDQATDRAYRIGQTKPVNVVRLVIKDSLEEKILALHAKKRELAADFLSGTQDVAAEAMKLSEEELLDLLS